MSPRALEQELRFLELDGARVAYSTVGRGPALVLPALWAGHLEREWATPEYRAFAGDLAADHTVIRYDRLGTGLSDRDVDPAALGVDLELRTLEALIDALELDDLALLGVSFGGCTAAAFAAKHPDRVRALALVGAFANGAGIAPPDLRDAMLATVRAHWGAGSRMLADVWIPGADAATRDGFAELQRAGASPELAAALLEAVYRADVTGLLPRIEAPTLVVHRRDDSAMPFALGRELATLIPGARLVALDGDIHLPWLGDSRAVLDALYAFLSDREPVEDGAPVGREPVPPVEDGPLSEREREVLRLVAEGLSDADIAERLVVSPHTVHRHVANIRTKLRQPSRAAAAAHAARRGLI
jgi:pimeloyl-ACP methyl ester carboxylesterase/DNA-binding CsgD family transcriptional regulator